MPIIQKDENLPLYFSRTESRQTHDVYLSGTINHPQYYVDIFNLIENAPPTDVINIFINSSGGDFWTAMQFVSVILRSEAHIHMSIEGEAHSAASLLFLSGDTYSVPEFASMLCHYYTSGYRGKGEEITQWSHHVESHYKGIFMDLYKGFLSETELKEMIKGKDFWFTGKEIVKRLTAKVQGEKKAVKSEEKSKKKTKKTKKTS